MILELSENELSGIILDVVWGLPNVVKFSLHSNNLSGPLSTSISTTANLVFLLVANKKFSRIIPSQIGLLNLLQVFDTKDNNLSGPLPCSMSKLSKLKFVFL